MDLLDLSGKQKSDLYAAYPHVEATVARVHQKRGREAELREFGV